MPSHRAIVRRRAKTDVNQIGVFIGERDLNAGLRFFDAAKAAFKLLSQNPGFGGLRTSRHITGQRRDLWNRSGAMGCGP